MTKNEAFFLRESVKHARSLSCGQAANFLRGMLMACGEIDIPESLRDPIEQMVESDRQLDMISSTDLQLHHSVDSQL